MCLCGALRGIGPHDVPGPPRDHGRLCLWPSDSSRGAHFLVSCYGLVLAPPADSPRASVRRAGGARGEGGTRARSATSKGYKSPACKEKIGRIASPRTEISILCGRRAPAGARATRPKQGWDRWPTSLSTNSTTPHEIDIVLGLLFQATCGRSLASVGPRGEAMTEKRRQGARWVGVDGAKAWTGVRE